MIIDNLERLARYKQLVPEIELIAEFIKERNLAAMKEGRYELSSTVFLSVEQTLPKTKEQAKLESHDKYIDIQLPLSSEECMGYLPREACNKIEKPYQADRDITFYANTPLNYFTVKPGMFVLFMPTDGHAPAISREGLRKMVFKIKVG